MNEHKPLSHHPHIQCTWIITIFCRNGFAAHDDHWLKWEMQLIKHRYEKKNVYSEQVEVIPWISSKHNMGFAFNRSTWRDVVRCANHFCTYDDYNWDWSLQHVSQQCLNKKLHAMVVKGPRVFHIGEWFVSNPIWCFPGVLNFISYSQGKFSIFLIFFSFYFSGVHHKKKNCESNQVISKVQQVLRIATKAHQLYPKSLTLTVGSVVKKSKLRKGNGGWSDIRDHNLCLNVTWASYWPSQLISWWKH